MSTVYGSARSAPSQASFATALSRRSLGSQLSSASAAMAPRSIASALSRLTRGPPRLPHRFGLSRTFGGASKRRPSRPRREIFRGRKSMPASFRPISFPPVNEAARRKADVPTTNQVPNSNSNSNWNYVKQKNANLPSGMRQYGTAATPLRTMSNYARSVGRANLLVPKAPQPEVIWAPLGRAANPPSYIRNFARPAGRGNLLANSIVKQTDRLRNALIENGVPKNVANREAKRVAFGKIQVLLGPNIQKAKRSAAFKQMRRSVMEKMQTRRAETSKAARARFSAIKQGGMGLAQRYDKFRAGVLAGVPKAAGMAQTRATLGGQAMWKGATAAATATRDQASKSRNAMFKGVGQSRNAMVGGARAAARFADSRIASPVNKGIIRRGRDMLLERRIAKIRAEKAQLYLQRNTITRGGQTAGRNVARVKNINARIKVLNAKKNLIESGWNAKNKKEPGLSWLKRFGRGQVGS